MRCRICQEEVAVRQTAVEGQVGKVAVLLEGMPDVACPSGHGQPVPGELAGDGILSALEEQIQVARSRLLRADACDHCGTPLTVPGRRTRRSVTATLPAGLPPVTATYDLPMVRCPECGMQQVPADASTDVLDATLDALEG